jgi:hypothetical protein
LPVDGFGEPFPRSRATGRAGSGSAWIPVAAATPAAAGWRHREFAEASGDGLDDSDDDVCECECGVTTALAVYQRICLPRPGPVAGGLHQPDGRGGTHHRRLADAVVVFGGWGLVEEDDQAVLVPLVEDLGGDQYALPRGDALGSVNFSTDGCSSLL